MGYETTNYKTVLIERNEGILLVTLNQPESLNALTLEMLEDLVTILRQAVVDPEVKVLLIMGSGKGFSAGGNVKAMLDPETGGKAHPLHRPPFNVPVMPPEERLEKQVVTGWKVMTTLWEFWKPTIAAINGLATGAGMDLSLVCDIRVMSDKAQICQAYTNIGIIPIDGGMFHLPRMVGLGKAYELMYTGEFIKADEALRLGLVNKVVPHDQLLSEAMDLARKIAKRPPVSLQMIKHMTQKALRMDFPEAIKYFYTAFEVMVKTEDHLEGVKAILEKRIPEFKGR
jgi:enoyl-CoA hydratase/carnithine racemase